MASFKDLAVWQKGVALTVSTYELCTTLPADEKYGISSQMKRAASAIPSNIAEGYRRNGRKEYRQFCGIALGSAAELETQLIIVSQVYSGLNCSDLLKDCDELQRMLSSLIAKL